MNKRTARGLKIAAIVIVVLVAACVVLRCLAAASLRRAYAALEAAGRPMRASALIPPPIPGEQNGALLCDAGAVLLKSRFVGEVTLLKRLSDLSCDYRTDSLKPEAIDELRGLLRDERTVSALRLVEEAAGKQGYRADLVYSEGFAMLVPHLADLRSLERILCSKALVEASDGRTDEAHETLLTALWLADALRSEPLLISQLVRCATANLANQTVQRVCAIAPPGPQQNAELRRRLAAFEDRQPFVLAMDGERLLCGERVFAQPLSERMNYIEDAHARPIARAGGRRGSIAKADHAVYLRIMHRHADMAEKPYSPENVGEIERMIREIPWYCPLAKIIVPALSQALEVSLRTSAAAATTRAGLALLAHRQEHGAFPATPGELTYAASETAPKDPFTGDGLHYEARGNGFIVYSVGTDAQDNGGDATKDENGCPRDIVWEYVPPGATE